MACWSCGKVESDRGWEEVACELLVGIGIGVREIEAVADEGRDEPAKRSEDISAWSIRMDSMYRV